MKTYLITIEVHIPVPRSFEYRQSASNAGAAISRALRMLRRDLPRRQIRDYRIKAIQL